MQEQDHSFEKGQPSARQASPVEGIHSFQEVVYPPRSAMSRWLQYFIGVGVGIAGIGATIVILFFLDMFEVHFDAMATLELLIVMFAFSSAISGVIMFICFQRIRFVACGLLTIALIVIILCSHYQFFGF